MEPGSKSDALAEVHEHGIRSPLAEAEWRVLVALLAQEFEAEELDRRRARSADLFWQERCYGSRCFAG